MSRFYFLKDLGRFLWRTKKWWLVPLVCLIFILALLIYTASISPVPIFVYPLV